MECTPSEYEILKATCKRSKNFKKGIKNLLGPLAVFRGCLDVAMCCECKLCWEKRQSKGIINCFP